MTADEFGTVDIDLLADYIGEALDDAERERVARLVADDPEWRSAYALLSPAVASMSAELGALGAAAEPMPDHLWVRLNDAFTVPTTSSVPSTDATAADSPVAEPSIIDPALAAPTEPHLAPVRGDRHLVSVPTSGSDRKRTSRRRRLRWAAPIAAAAGVVAFAGLGAGYLSDNKSADDSASSAGAAQVPLDAPEAATGPAALTDDQITATGTDYSAQSLRAAAPVPSPDPMVATDRGDRAERTSKSPASAAVKSPPSTAAKSLAADPALSRLGARDALMACLEAITVENAGGPITVLIVRFTAGGVTQAWATGPDCGASGRDAQVRGRVRVG
jgi:hypothetical protein